ncbi:hypothetical protein DYB32_003684 [Aphanomyces invadans]|uniref:Uncharacterized protein n=1 Tax=Aphanomyces invadans TaxID=157072 RepID=A0A3R7D2B3_9STRA|nr:hypothetical protein DYB32_003684 [Aphanomyces invadans]
MHVGACIDPFYKRRIAMFDLGKSHGDVTETEWVAWFMEAHDEEPAELDALKRRLQIAVQFDTRILDADSRVRAAQGQCLKCQSTEHRVREHPGITDGRVKKLMDEVYASCRGVNAMKNSDKSNSIECRATLDDVLVQPRVLLYSGSDESLESNGLLQALERLGSRPSVVDKPFVKLKPFGVNSLSLKVTRQINLLIGRPVMERLGFSLDDMLVDALMKCQTREVGDLGDGEDKPRTFQRLQEMYGDDAEELDVACSTLSMEKTADSDG